MSVLSAGIINYIPNSNYGFLDVKENEIAPQRGKKRRLDHLTWEEKLQRKKLKNRVAAQTSRDRKKAKIEQMEKSIEELFKKNEQLLSECNDLKAMNQKLMDENAALRKQLRGPCDSCNQSRTVECDVQQGSAESFPLPQGLKRAHSAAALSQQTFAAALWKIVLACLLYQTCSTSSITMSISSPLSSSRKVSCKISPQTWKLLLKKQIARNQSIFKETVPKEWWGRHQKMWNPVDARA